ncbi:conserved hypothetical protein [Vibrio phage 468E53-1]|nr:conserved hypothetical protein [Vibrio phage 468E53-1]
MSTIDTLAVNELALRGKGVEFNKFSRMFKNKEDALSSIETGDYVPTPGQTNAVIILGEGIMIYSFDLLDFVHISQFIHAGDQSNKYISLDGVNDHIEFDAGVYDALDFTKDWSIGMTFVGLVHPTSSKKYSIFGRGGVQLTLQASTGTNWGLYVTSDNDLYNADKRAQANTWYRPGDLGRILFTYNATEKRLKYYIGDPSTGTYAMRANISIPQSMIDGQDINGGLAIGKPFTGVGGSSFSGHNLEAGVNNMIVSGITMTGPQLDEYFQTGEGFPAMELYADLDSYCKLGEDVYPAVSDEKGLLLNGTMVNGAADDFKDIPEA